jgi:hypothetical protein
VFVLGNLFPLVGIWIPPGAGGSVVVPTVEWFVTGTIGVGGRVGALLVAWVVFCGAEGEGDEAAGGEGGGAG